jgi:hypothetical protein
MAEREVRIAHTKALFRDVNERIAESADRFDARDAWSLARTVRRLDPRAESV